jgi:hypothetical protein
MPEKRSLRSICRWRAWAAVLLTLGVSLFLGVRPAHAQDDGQVQQLSGRIDPGEIILYRLPDLQAGQTVYVRMEGTSGNLDPVVALIDPSVDPEVLEAAVEAAIDQAVAEGADPLEALDAIREQYTLAFDDDGGGGLVAALEYEVPAGGEYRLLAGGALSILGGETFGDYDLVVGLDAPQVLIGEAEPAGDTIAVLDAEATPPGAGVQQITGSFTPEKRSTFVELHDLKPGDTLYATVEATSARPSFCATMPRNRSGAEIWTGGTLPPACSTLFPIKAGTTISRSRPAVTTIRSPVAIIACWSV